jgi:hypothetical protein
MLTGNDAYMLMPSVGPQLRAHGHRAKTVLTEVGPVEIDVPRDRDGSFEPRIVAKRQRRLSDEITRLRGRLRSWGEQLRE